MPASNARNSARESEAHQWLDKYGDYLFSYAFKHLRHIDVAEDLVQDTLLAALKAREAFGGQSSIRTWLVGILKHKIVDHIRHTSTGVDGRTNEGGAREADLAQWADRQFTHAGKWKTVPDHWRGEPSEEIERTELRQALNDCLAKLPERSAHIFLLAERDQKPAEKLGKLFGLSTTNIAVIMYRARLALRQCLERRWFNRRQKEIES